MALSATIRESGAASTRCERLLAGRRDVRQSPRAAHAAPRRCHGSSTKSATERRCAAAPVACRPFRAGNGRGHEGAVVASPGAQAGPKAELLDVGDAAGGLDRDEDACVGDSRDRAGPVAGAAELGAHLDGDVITGRQRGELVRGELGPGVHGAAAFPAAVVVPGTGRGGCVPGGEDPRPQGSRVEPEATAALGCIDLPSRPPIACTLQSQAGRGRSRRQRSDLRRRTRITR